MWCPNTDKKAEFVMELTVILSFLALKKAFAENEEIQEMAQNNFVMLNLMHETTDKNLSPDGQYVPRIMFVAPLIHVFIYSISGNISQSVGIALSSMPEMFKHARRKGCELAARDDIG
ncbi:hypothetical protein WISP_57458 [Willisornis vidua]|uniref:Uncharacterized protein n=1 Tax=Willisornis vidua TaxID=1566151 RepID=A0ABQ9DBL7_9PASS|nr:hypothetical protein WISP_57458 [Willisornis vidua]